LLLSGDPGMGKTRILTELRSRAADRGAVILTAEAAAEAALPAQPIVDALLPLAGELSALPAADATLLRSLFHTQAEHEKQLAAARPDQTAPPGDQSSASPPEEPARAVAPEETARAVACVLTVSSTTPPVALIIDDLHWADSATLDLLDDLVLRL